MKKYKLWSRLTEEVMEITSASEIQFKWLKRAQDFKLEEIKEEPEEIYCPGCKWIGKNHAVGCRNNGWESVRVDCHCGKDGHALNSVNCPAHGQPKKEECKHERVITSGSASTKERSDCIDCGLVGVQKPQSKELKPSDRWMDLTYELATEKGFSYDGAQWKALFIILDEYFTHNS